MKQRWVALLLGAAVTWPAAWRAWPRQGEDFAYYWCAGRLSAAGVSPYAREPFQDCLRGPLGGANPNLSAVLSSAYPAPALPLFAVLGALPYGTAFALWNILLAGASGAVLLWLGATPATALLLAVHPGLWLSWGYHKVALLLLPCLLWGARLTGSGRVRAGTLLFAPLAFKPQLAGAVILLLAVQRRWRPAAWTAGWMALASLPALAVLGPEAVTGWLASASQHARVVFPFDSQSLFAALYKPVRAFFPGPTPGLLAAQTFLGAAVLGGTLWALRRRGLEESAPPLAAALLLALPYSSGGDSLWALPLLAAALRGAPPAAWGPAIVAAAVAAPLLGWYDPITLSRLAYQDRAGYLTLACVGAAWLAYRSVKGTTISPSEPG